MDGRVYNYNAGPWNPCNDNFQAACLELQNPAAMANQREAHVMMRDPNKAVSSATPSFMFLNYPTADDHIHAASNQHVMHRRAAAAAQWQLPQWPKVKAHQAHSHKNFGMMKDDWSSMATTMHAGSHPLFNIPPPGPFCTSDLTDAALQDNCGVSLQHHTPHHAQQACALSYTVVHSNPGLVEAQQMQQHQHQTHTVPPQPLPQPPQTKPAVKKSNPQPRKKRERKKKTMEKETKKRTRNEESWARNKRKKARARGESYMSVVGKVMRAKEVQSVDCSKCKFHCPDHVSEEDRQKLFKHYWSLESFKDKVNFLSDCVEEFVPLRPISGKRLYSRRYKLKIGGEGDDENIARVCKEFFISTFDISESTIVTFMNKKRKNPEEIKDNRGHQIPSNKTPPEVVQTIREHILSQTGLQGCLTKLHHLEEVKNIKRLYTHYQSECETEDRKPASMSVYRKVYGDMHKDKKEAPVILPPEDVLEKISPGKKSKPLKEEEEEEMLPVAQADDDDDEEEEEAEMGVDDDGDDDDEEDDSRDLADSLPVEPLNLTPPNAIITIPSSQQLPQLSQPPPQPSSSSSSSSSTSASTSTSSSLSSSTSSSSSCFVVAQSGICSSNGITASNTASSHNQSSHLLTPHPTNHPHNHIHTNSTQAPRHPSSHQNKQLYAPHLHIPMTSSTSHLTQNLLDSVGSGGQMVDPTTDSSANAIVAPSFDTAGAHINQLMPFVWGTHRITQHSINNNNNNNINGQAANINIRNMQQPSFSTGPSVFPNPNPNSNPHPMHQIHMTQSCLFASASSSSNPTPSLGTTSMSMSSTSTEIAFPSGTTNPTNPLAVYNASSMAVVGPAVILDNPGGGCGGDDGSLLLAHGDEEVVVVKKLKKKKKTKPSGPRPKAKPKKEVKKRTRNEDLWGRNIRKRLRFKGEEYTSVKGKTVGAKTVLKVNCSKCKYKCSTKITEEQRIEMNDVYWNLEDYENRIKFMSKYVQTYVPKRKMTGRRAYSRNYTFIVDGKHIRVCKNFFISTLHISESIVATCLKKARKGPTATKDMRGKHKPVNKTPEQVLQSIRELIIYLTGVRPKRKGETTGKAAAVRGEYQDVNRLYLIYKYDSEQKGKKIASHGIFRNVLLNEFGITGNSKFKKSSSNKTKSKLATTKLSSSGSSGSSSSVLVVDVKNNSHNPATKHNGKKSQHQQQLSEEGSQVVRLSSAAVGGSNPKMPQSASSSSLQSSSSASMPVFNGSHNLNTDTNTDTASSTDIKPSLEPVEVYEGSSTHPVFSTCLLSSF